MARHWLTQPSRAFLPARCLLGLLAPLSSGWPRAERGAPLFRDDNQLKYVACAAYFIRDIIARSPSGHACCDSLGHSFPVWNWRAHFRNALAAVERPGIWELGVVRCPDSFQLSGGSGVGQRHRSIVESSAVAAVASLRRTGTGRGIIWLHDCLWSAAARGMAEACLANAVGLSAGAHWIAFFPIIPDPVDTDNGDGPDTAGIGGRSDSAPRKFRAGDRFSLWLEHIRRGSWGGGWRSLFN